MKKNFIFKFLISIALLMVSQCAISKENTFVSLSPALTEIMFAIDAQDSLKGVSTHCSYPKEAKLKEKIGNTFYINDEKILKIKPTYILAMDSSGLQLSKYKKFGITPLCFKNPNVESISDNILALGKLTNKQENAKIIVNNLNNKIAQANLHRHKKILYLIQTYPMISIGKDAFITDIINKSGNISVTANITGSYPTISEEYLIKQTPDIIVLSFYSDTKRIKKLFPNAKIIYLSEEENNIINRPGPRIYKSIEFFAKL